jgi:dienelactone hydrolase
MPDFFEGEPADISWYPPDNDEKRQKLGGFFQTKAAPPKTLPRVPKAVQEISAKESKLEKWGIVGFCWGGKVSACLVSWVQDSWPASGYPLPVV